MKRPIIWVVVDALRYDVLMEYIAAGGFSFLPEDAVVFTNAEAQGSWTYPSFFSFLSGRYPFNCGVSSIEMRDGLPLSHCGHFRQDIPYLFDYLSAAGIRCRSFLDKWMSTLNFAVEKKAGVKIQGRDFFVDRWYQHRDFHLRKVCNATPGKMLAYAVDAFKEGAGFLFFRLMDVHDSGILGDYAKGDRSGGMAGLKQRYFEVLERLERGFLRPLFEWEPIFIFHSDHGDAVPGEDFAAQHFGHAGFPLGPLTRVPLVVSGLELKGMEAKAVMLVDLVPTLLNHLGISHTGFDGEDIRWISDARIRYADSAGFSNGVSLLSGDCRWIYSPALGGARAYRTEAGYEVQGACVSLWEMWQRFEAESRVRTGPAAGPEILEEKLKALGYL